MGGADIPEVFEMTDRDRLELGDVVSIDPQNPPHQTKSLTAYDTKVAEIVSSAEQAASIIGVRRDGTSDKPVIMIDKIRFPEIQWVRF